uniref:Uncharacterized protein n=1 Tax=Angiostrongylus cantonensis TaxID=6313 RepID=A0A0K0CXC3_ANGCA
MGYERKGTSGTVGGHAVETTRSSPTQAQTKTSGRWHNSPALPPRTRSRLIPIRTGRKQSSRERYRPLPGIFDEPRDGPSRLRVTRRRAAGRFGAIDFYGVVRTLTGGLSSNESLCRLNTKYGWYVMLFVTSATVVRSESLGLPYRLVTLTVYYIENKTGSVVISIRISLMREPGLIPGQGE